MLQNLLIRLILDPLNQLMNKLPEKTRDLCFLVGGIGILSHNFLRNMNLVTYRFLIFFAVNCVFLGLMILGGMGKEVRPAKFNKPLLLCWMGVGIMMLQSGIRNNMDYLPEALLFLVAYPVLFICWSSGDRTRIFRLLIKLCRIGAVMFALGSFLLIPISHRRYAGLFTNTNMAAYLLAVLYAGIALHLLYEKFTRRSLIDVMLIGILASLNYYSNSRSGTLALIVGLGGGLAIYVLTHKKADILSCLPKIAACAIASTLCISTMLYVFQLRAYLPLPYLDQVNRTLYVNHPWFSQEEPGVTDPLGTDMGETMPTEPTFFDLSDFEDLNDKKLNTDDKTLDQYSTGRLSIWLHYAGNLNLLGHEAVEPLYMEQYYKYINSTHMTILQVAYESGILAGVFYLLLNIGTGLLSIRFAIRKKDEPYALMPLVFTLVFGVLSVLGSCGVSFWYMPTFYYYVVQFPILVSPDAQ